METIKKYMPSLLIFVIGSWLGFFIGSQYYPRIETQTVTVDKPVIIQGEAKTETKTQIAYVPKETVIERYIDANTGKEVTATKPESTDLDARIGKTDFNVKLNGKDVQFKKTDDEKFMFDKNKIALNQSSTISFDATVTPQVIDQTKRWGLGVGYGDNGIAYKVDFPIGGSNYFGGWVYKDDASKAGGVMVRF